MDRRQPAHEHGLLPRRLRLRDRPLHALDRPRPRAPAVSPRHDVLPGGARHVPPGDARGRPDALHHAAARPRRQAPTLHPRDVSREGGLSRLHQRADLAARRGRDPACGPHGRRGPATPRRHQGGPRRAAAPAAGGPHHGPRRAADEQMDERFDLVIRGGTVYDGSGAPGVRADVGVRGDRIVAVGPITARGAEEVDARGLAVAPGFIDVHSHDDYAVLVEPEMPFKTLQGVTSNVVGNCGSGVVPFEAGLIRFRRMHPTADPEPWDGFAGYLARVDAVRPSCNVAVLMGHGSLRRGAMGLEPRAPSASELDRMRAWVREGVEAGAVGLSTGLIYEPGRYATTDEVIALAREVAAAGGGLYATHMRNEADGLLDAVREAIRIGEEAGVPVQISHHKASGRRNWGRVRDSLGLIEQARARALDVTADQ